MSTVYILYEHPIDNCAEASKIVGVVTKEEVAIHYVIKCSGDPNSITAYTYIELDDPELLNRIAKESENNKNGQN